MLLNKFEAVVVGSDDTWAVGVLLNVEKLRDAEVAVVVVGSGRPKSEKASCKGVRGAGAPPVDTV